LLSLKRLSNLIKYGFGDEARQKKQADKKAAKQARFESENWVQDAETARRRYASYEDYVEHQASKLYKVIGRLQENMDEEFEEFKARFQSVPALADARSVLCLGARLGTEVKALHALGHFAVGIDLNPGADNAYVLPGDFHAIVFPDGSVDAIYSNAIDHAFDLQKLIGEVRRLLRPGGLFLIEIEVGFGEGHTPGSFESLHWRDSDAFIEKIRAIGEFEIIEIQDLGQTRRNRRKQILFRKPG